MRVLINAQMLPGGLAGGTEQFLMGLVYGLGRASDGPEEYILIGHWKDPEWLQPYLGPNQKIVSGKPDRRERLREILGPLWLPAHLARRMVRSWVSGRPYSTGGLRFRRFLRVLRRRGDSFSVPNLRPVRNTDGLVSSVTKWPRIAVFGGKIELTWPDNKQPEWAVRDWLVGFAFPRHHYAETEAFYKPLDYPFGPNFWVRKVVFQKVPFFDETIGARPRNRIMGEEATFLLNLQEHGFQILYYPQAVVYHRNAFTLPWLRHRAYTWGRGRIRLYGWHRMDLYRKDKVLWCTVLAAEEFYNVLRFFAGIVLSDPERNCERTVGAMIILGQLHETVNQVLKTYCRIAESKFVRLNQDVSRISKR
jgi:hypothetical protein